MNVLGIHDGHNSSAALLVDGMLVAACEEERFTGEKNQGGLPSRALEEVLREAGLSIDDVDVVAVADRYTVTPVIGPNTFSREAQRRRHDRMLRTGDPLFYLKHHVRRIPPLIDLRRGRQERARQAAFTQLFPGPEVQLVDHHHCHAAAAYYGWGRLDERVLVLTADGAGDDLCASVSIGEGGTLERLHAVHRDHSLGGLWAGTTYLLGMQPTEHEYKLMGLAPYADGSGESERLVAALREWFVGPSSDDPLGWRRRKGLPPMVHATRALRKLFGRSRFDHIAAALQSFTEEMVTRWVASCIEHTGATAVAVSGGLFMNVKANQRISELEQVEDLFVMPASGDVSNCIGAAYLAYQRTTKRAAKPLNHLYLGPDLDEHAIKRALAAAEVDAPGHLSAEWPDDPELAVARLLADGHIVARMKGRMEFGPRALGNRSILADPSRPDVVQTINESIKSRDFWMPFAPAMPAEHTDRYVRKPKARVLSPYMMITYAARDEKVNALAAALHPKDRTARVQEVLRKMNPTFHQLLMHFEELRGESALLNTSFNLHGYPLARTAEDGLAILRDSALRHLQLGDAIVTKR